MSVAFSMTTLRVPQGFGNLLEGLAREVLRDQPDNIPAFAAQYFTALLQKREETGYDPAKWGAEMEHRISTNDTFNDATNKENGSLVKETETSGNEDRVFLVDSSANGEEKITHPTHGSSPSPETHYASKDVVEPEPQPDSKQNISEDESEMTDSELNPGFSYSGIADIDKCTEELNTMEMAEEQMLENVQDPVNVNEENETAEKELDPITLSSYHGLADIDVCSEELQTTLQEEEHTEGSRDVTVPGAGFIPSAESPDPVSVEQDDLDNYDKFALSGTNSPLYVEQDADKEFNDISYNEIVVTSHVKGDEIEETGHLSEDDTEISNSLFVEDVAEIHNAEKLHLSEGTENINVSEEANTFHETYPDEIPLGVENQQANDILAAESISESSFILKKSPLTDRNNKDSPGMEHLANVASEIQEKNNDCESVTDITADTDERNSQTNMQEGETNDEKQTDPQDHIDIIDNVEEMEGLVDSNLNHTGYSAEDANNYYTRTSQQDEDEVDAFSETDEETNGVNETQTQEDHLFYNTITNESLPIPSSVVTELDTDPTYELSATDLQEYTEELETTKDYEESELQEDKIHESILENENMELDQQEESSQPQEEEDIMDIPLDDPEANKAATKIQAGFRGHMTRKKLKPGDKPGEEVSSTGETLNGSQGDAAGGSEGVETDETSVPEQ